MNFSGLVTPNYGQMGTENLPAGNGPAIPYGAGNPAASGPVLSTGTMQGPSSPATSNIGYRPTSGRADRLDANIVGGYSGGATTRI